MKKSSNPIVTNQIRASYSGDTSSYNSDPFSTNNRVIVQPGLKIDLHDSNQIQEQNAFDEESSPVSPELLRMRQESNIQFML